MKDSHEAPRRASKKAGPVVHLLQADGRGRILLPKNLRNQKLYEFQESADQAGLYLLHAMRAERIEGGQSDVQRLSTVSQDILRLPAWTPPEAWKYIELYLLPEIAALCSNKPKISAGCIYGSYARSEAFNTSDLDLVLFAEGDFGRRDQRKLEDELDQCAEPYLEKLRSKHIFTRLSSVFLPSKPAPEMSSLMYSIATDARLVWQRDNFYSEWKAFVFEKMEKLEVRRVLRGQEWIWEEKQNG